MKPSYQRDLEHNYMVLETPGKRHGTEYQIRMILLNEIAGILKCKMRMIDGVPKFYYEITSKQPMARIFEKNPMTCEDIKALLRGMEAAIEGVLCYFLDACHFIIDPDFIYMDVETKEVFLCYLPFYEGDIVKDFSQLAEYILKKLDHSDEKAVLWGYEIYSKTSIENYSIKAVIQSIYQKISAAEQREKELPMKVDSPLLAKREENDNKKTDFQEEKEHKKQKIMAYIFQKKTIKIVIISLVFGTVFTLLFYLNILNLTQVGGILFLIGGSLIYLVSNREKILKKGKKRKAKSVKCLPEKKDILVSKEDEIYESYEEHEEEYKKEENFGMTTILETASSGENPTLISMNAELRENVVIAKDVMLIGKLKGQVDISLNLPVLSRIHAKIEKRPEGYFLTDLNSTNGTFLNSIRLESNECKKIQTGDEIFFAKVGYYFKE